MFLRRDTLNNLFKNYDFQYFIKENEILKRIYIANLKKKRNSFQQNNKIKESNETNQLNL